MHPKVAEVFSKLSKDYFIAHEEVEENRIIVKTPLTALDHATYITFSVTGDVLRLDFKHIFGVLDVENHGDFEDIASILLDNNGSFQMSSAYLAIELFDSLLYTSLQTYRTFMMKWASEDIADQINLAFYDIHSAFFAQSTGISGQWPSAIKLFAK